MRKMINSMNESSAKNIIANDGKFLFIKQPFAGDTNYPLPGGRFESDGGEKTLKREKEK
jgi:hypothetical protein